MNKEIEKIEYEEMMEELQKIRNEVRLQWRLQQEKLMDGWIKEALK